MAEADCNLLDDWGKIVQVICAVVAFLILVLKRHLETPRRPWIIWAMDVTKQGTSGILAHFVGMGTAELVSHSVGTVSACSWYLVAFGTDVTVGLFFSLVFLKAGQALGERCNSQALAKTGDYGQSVDDQGRLLVAPNRRIWFYQMMFWSFCCVVPARFICMGVVYTSRHTLVSIASFIGSQFDNPKTELLFVMLFGPLFCNAIQFLVQDYYLKLQKRRQTHRSSNSLAHIDDDPEEPKAGGDATTVFSDDELLLEPHPVVHGPSFRTVNSKPREMSA